MWCCSLDMMVTVHEQADDSFTWVSHGGNRFCVRTASLCSIDSFVETALLAAEALEDGGEIPPDCNAEPDEPAVDIGDVDDASNDVPDVEVVSDDVSVADSLATSSPSPITPSRKRRRKRYIIMAYAVRDSCSF